MEKNTMELEYAAEQKGVGITAQEDNKKESSLNLLGF